VVAGAGAGAEAFGAVDAEPDDDGAGAAACAADPPLGDEVALLVAAVIAVTGADVVAATAPGVVPPTTTVATFCWTNGSWAAPRGAFVATEATFTVGTFGAAGSDEGGGTAGVGAGLEDSESNIGTAMIATTRPASTGHIRCSRRSETKLFSEERTESSEGRLRFMT
jgi:hypothetical protein